MAVHSFRAFGLIAAAVLSACAGNAVATTPQAHESVLRARFTINVPRHLHHVRIRTSRLGRPAYVSASTQGMTFALSGNGMTPVNETVALTPGSPNCTSGSTGTTCTIFSNPLVPCPTSSDCYTASVSTYDAVSCGGSACTIPPSAHELSTGQNLPFAIVRGSANAVSLTLSGVPASLSFAPGDDLTRVNAGISGFDLYGPGAHAIAVTANDLDGNAIVGPGAPTFTVGANTGTLNATAAGGTEVLVTPPQAFDGTHTATFLVKPTYAGQSTDGCAQPGANCSGATLNADMLQVIAVADCVQCGGSSRKSEILFYAIGGTTPLATLTISSWDSVTLVTNAAGDLFAGTLGEGIYAFQPPFKTGMAPWRVVTMNVNQLQAFAGDPNGNLYVQNDAALASTTIARCDTTLTCSIVVATAPTVAGSLFTLAADANGDIATLSKASPCTVTVYSGANYAAPPTTLSGGALGSQGCGSLRYASGNNLFIRQATQVVECASDLTTATTIDLSSVAAPLYAADIDSAGDLIVLGNGTSNGQLFIIDSATLASHRGGTISAPDASATVPAPSRVVVAGGSGAVAWLNTSYNGSMYAGQLGVNATPSLTAIGSPVAASYDLPEDLLLLP